MSKKKLKAKIRELTIERDRLSEISALAILEILHKRNEERR